MYFKYSSTLKCFPLPPICHCCCVPRVLKVRRAPAPLQLDCAGAGLSQGQQQQWCPGRFSFHCWSPWVFPANPKASSGKDNPPLGQQWQAEEQEEREGGNVLLSREGVGRVGFFLLWGLIEVPECCLHSAICPPQCGDGEGNSGAGCRGWSNLCNTSHCSHIILHKVLDPLQGTSYSVYPLTVVKELVAAVATTNSLEFVSMLLLLCASMSLKKNKLPHLR